MTPKSEFGSRVKFFFGKFSLEMIEFILIRNPNEILRVKLSKLGFHFQNFIPYKKRPQIYGCTLYYNKYYYRCSKQVPGKALFLVLLTDLQCCDSRLLGQIFLYRKGVVIRFQIGFFGGKRTPTPLGKNWEIFIIIYVFLVYFRYFH